MTKKYLKSELSDLIQLIRQKLRLRYDSLSREFQNVKTDTTQKVYKEIEIIKFNNKIKAIEVEINKLRDERTILENERQVHIDGRRLEVNRELENHPYQIDMDVISKLNSTFEERLIMAKMDGKLTEEAKKIFDEIDGTDPNRENVVLWKKNILKVVKDHKKNCPGKDCDISTFLLKTMAEAAGIKFTEKEFGEFM